MCVRERERESTGAAIRIGEQNDQADQCLSTQHSDDVGGDVSDLINDFMFVAR